MASPTLRITHPLTHTHNWSTGLMAFERFRSGLVGIQHRSGDLDYVKSVDEKSADDQASLAH